MKNNLFICYPKCTTCQKAKKWLLENNISFQERHIVEQTPSKEELKQWIKQSKDPIKKFFNTSGLQYKENKIKEKLPDMTEAEQIELLASNGMLIKRPIFVTENQILIGFKIEEWKEILKK